MSWIMDFTTNFIFPHISRLCWLFGLLRILLSFCKMAMNFTTNFNFRIISRLCCLFGLLRILLSFCKMAMNFTTNFNFPDYFKVVLALWTVANTAKLLQDGHEFHY